MKILLLPFLAISLLMGFSKTKPASCNGLKTGVFYYYPKTGSDAFKIIREKSLQKEVNLRTGDTSFWTLKWPANCTYTVKFISGQKQQSAQEKEFFLSHETIVQVLDISENYYSFKGALDSLTNSFSLADTMWMVQK